jgi:hypothetical protein
MSNTGNFHRQKSGECVEGGIEGVLDGSHYRTDVGPGRRRVKGLGGSVVLGSGVE